MPIYAYRCSSCGHAADVLQKMSDPVLTACPSCHAETLVKQLTAPGFQLKGSGWYATDFKGGGNASGSAAAAESSTDSASTSTPASTPPCQGGSGGCGCG
ncbi:MAG: zinc ribbon domain-containing protein [Sterolibacterium sp.]|nr:zinc ribbon domain-containing protein [Sterolibacterium sp.]MBP9799564.1 zinc ribbon domain-containing protein [Sterolibacterium sp.]